MNIVIKNRLSSIEKLLAKHSSIAVMGMPGGGISLFLRELSRSNLGKAVFIDVFSLPELSMTGLFSGLAEALGTTDKTVAGCKNQLQKLTKNNQPVIIYFAGFDQLQPVLNSELLQALNSLARTDNVRLVFGLCVSLKKLIPDAVFDSGLRLFGNVYYLAPYSHDELRYWLENHGPTGWQKRPDLQKMLELSGGHVQLLLQLLENSSLVNDGQPEPIGLLFKNLYKHLLGPQRTIVRKIAENNKRVQPDEYLLGIGMVSKGGTLFSPLFADYLRQLHTSHLPAKERRLFLLLKKNLGQVVPKQQIIDTVWGDEIVSDWALNALVYRLRKHPAFLARNFSIENHKKLGYVLTKNP